MTTYTSRMDKVTESNLAEALEYNRAFIGCAYFDIKTERCGIIRGVNVDKRVNRVYFIVEVVAKDENGMNYVTKTHPNVNKKDSVIKGDEQTVSAWENILKGNKYALKKQQWNRKLKAC